MNTQQDKLFLLNMRCTDLETRLRKIRKRALGILLGEKWKQLLWAFCCRTSDVSSMKSSVVEGLFTEYNNTLTEFLLSENTDGNDVKKRKVE